MLGISRRSMCIGACHACTASLCDLRDPSWGDPGFRHCDFFAWHHRSSGNYHGFVLLLLQVMTCSGRGTQVAWSLRFMRSFWMTHSMAVMCCAFGFCLCLVWFCVCLFLVVCWCFSGSLRLRIFMWNDIIRFDTTA